MTTYRVHFPGLTQNLHRDFTDQGEAQRFHNTRRDAAGSMWRHVSLEVIESAPVTNADRMIASYAKNKQETLRRAKLLVEALERFDGRVISYSEIGTLESISEQLGYVLHHAGVAEFAER